MNENKRAVLLSARLGAVAALVAASGLAGAQNQPSGVVPRRNIPGLGTQPGAQPQNRIVGELGAQPEDEPSEPAPRVIEGEESVSLAAFSEPIELETLVNLVAESLGINIVIKGSSLSGSVMFNAPVQVPKDELLLLLDSLLEQWDYTITMTDFGLYTIVPIGETKSRIGSTTRIIPTPNVKPSLLQNAVNTIGGNLTQVNYLDELGVIVATAAPMQLNRLEDLIHELLERYKEMVYARIELNYIAAPVARERALGLVGASSSTGAFGAANFQNRGGQVQPGQQQPSGIVGPSLDNLGDRLAVDFQGNALIFRGTPDELETVRKVIDVIDVANTLEPREYYAGSAALQIADIASQRGLGEVKVLESASSSQNDPFNFQRAQQAAFGNQFGQSNDTPLGGPVMVVDPQRQSIIYYGTPSQHEQLAGLMEELRTEDDRIVIREYKLHNADSESVADLITGLITGQSASGDAPLLPTGQSVQPQVVFQGGFGGGGGGEDEVGAFDPNKVFVIADVANNQVVVKAPLKQQDEFGKLIERLDLRRPQVYIEATIVSVSDNRDFHLAIETQITAGQFQLGTNFGLHSAGSTFQSPVSVATGLAGLTTAVIKSSYVPFILNAIKTDSDSRILSTPSLLVNDNEDARIVSLDQQATTTTTIGQTADQTTFAGYQDAGTTLEVTPSISEGGFLRLDYRVELSNFTGQGSGGVPPPRQERTVEGQVTIPSDATIVVGGIRVDDVRDTIVKIPLLGDIPLVKHAFRDTRKVKNSSTLYVFITPRIMTDPNFYDLKLFTKGPQSQMGLEQNIPELEPVRIELSPTWSAPAPAPMRQMPPHQGEQAPQDNAMNEGGQAPPVELIEEDQAP
ncbi:MAG: secretin N-terminal domain-containing protein [Phycisphaerales bacterium]